MVEAKSSIILTSGNSPLDQLRKVLDDDERSATELWDSVVKLYTTFNPQEIFNLEQEQENSHLEDN